jgi:hypothetical protein
MLMMMGDLASQQGGGGVREPGGKWVGGGPKLKPQGISWFTFYLQNHVETTL